MTAAIEKPVRVQRKRVKGWKMPENTVYVGRPSKWGNPFKVSEYGNVGAVWKYEKWLDETIEGQLVKQQAPLELKGKNLACFCPVSEFEHLVTCHADVLLELANSEETEARP